MRFCGCVVSVTEKLPTLPAGARPSVCTRNEETGVTGFLRSWASPRDILARYPSLRRKARRSACLGGGRGV